MGTTASGGGAPERVPRPRGGRTSALTVTGHAGGENHLFPVCSFCALSGLLSQGLVHPA